MKAHLVLLSILLLTAEYISAQQWYRATSNLYGRDINSVFIFNRHKMFYAGGSEQPLAESIFTSDDYGLSWDFIFDNPYPWIKSIAFSDTLHGFVVGFNGVMAKSLNGYTNWSYVTPPVVTDYNKVVYADAQTLFAVGGNKNNDFVQLIIKSVDGGSNWSVSYNQPGKWLKSVYFSDTQTGIAVGDSGAILKTIDGGTSWTPVQAPVARNFNAITFTNNTTGFIVGGKENNDSVRTILKTINGGNSWSIVKDEPGVWLTDVTFVDPNTGYAVGYKATLYKTTDGGQNWVPQNITPASGNEKLTSIKFNDPDFGLIGGDAGNAFIYTNATLPQLDTAIGYYQDSTTEIVKGLVNTHGTPTVCYMAYSTSPSFSPLYTSYNQYITSDTFANVGIFLTGLTTNTTYYYRLMVNSILGTQVGVTRSFYTWTPRYTIETQPAENVTLNAAVMRGSVDKLFMPTTPYFIYSNLPSLANGITRQVNNGQINDTLHHDAWAYISSLPPNTTYYYTLWVQTPYGFISGDTLSFTTHDPGYSFQTIQPVNVTATSATIQGTVDSLPEPVNLFFEYDTTPDFTHTITATPAVVNDNAYHLATANLTGLLPYTVYFYRLRGTGNGTQYFGQQYSFFTNNNHFQVQTLPATDTTVQSATLHGSVDKFMYPVTLYFEYGTFPGAWGQTIPATPATVSDSNYHSVTAAISGLTPGTMYFYRLRVISNGLTFYGAENSFYTGDPFSYIQAETATYITNTSAQLNGSVAGLKASASVIFQYAASPANWISAPASMGIINDSLPHSVYVSINGLSPGQVYYYRLKVDVAGVTIYSDIRQLYTGESEIPNWDFQYWSEDTALLPEAWNVVDDGFEQVPGHSGNYGFKIKENGITIMGLMDGNGVYGGVPFNARPDSLVFYAITDFASGDSGAFMLYLHRDTTTVAYNFFNIGGINGGYQRFAFPISYSAAGLPDSLVMAFIPFNFNGSHMQNTNSLTIDDISFMPPTAPVYNADMEHWFSHPHSTLLNWAYPKYIMPGSGLNQVNKALFNQPADYALEINNVNAYGYWTGIGVTSTEDVFVDNTGGFPVNTRHQTLNGYYKWFPVNGDTLDINVRFLLQGDMIGWGEILQPDSVPQFTAFEIPITYNNSLQFPETAIVSMSAFRQRAKGPSRLIIDKLRFDGFTLANDNLWVNSIGETGLKIYPNPTKDRVIIETENEIREGDYVQLFNLNGQLLYQINLTAGQTKTELNMADLTAGFYLLNVKTGDRLLNGKVVVAK